MMAGEGFGGKLTYHRQTDKHGSGKVTTPRTNDRFNRPHVFFPTSPEANAARFHTPDDLVDRV